MDVWLCLEKLTEQKRLNVRFVVQPDGHARPHPDAELIAEDVSVDLAKEIIEEFRSRFPGSPHFETYRK